MTPVIGAVVDDFDTYQNQLHIHPGDSAIGALAGGGVCDLAVIPAAVPGGGIAAAPGVIDVAQDLAALARAQLAEAGIAGSLEIPLKDQILRVPSIAGDGVTDEAAVLLKGRYTGTNPRDFVDSLWIDELTKDRLVLKDFGNYSVTYQRKVE